MSVRNHFIFWSLVIILTAGFVLLFHGILTPFILGLIFGYLLDPMTDRLEAIKVPRGIAAFIVLSGFFIFLVLVFALLVPVLEAQFVRMATVLPDYIQTAKAQIKNVASDYLQPYFEANIFSSENLTEKYGQRAIEWGTGVVKNLWTGGQALFSLISLLVITPVVAFYLLRDWDKMVAQIDSYLPARNRDKIHSILHDIDQALSGFLRGQALVCLILGLFYAIGLTLVGLDFGLLIGLFIGLVSFVPYIGAIFGGILCIGLALLQFGSLTPVLIVAAIFAVGQFLEGNVLAPKFVGDNVNLHPVWILFALLAGGSLMGFTGMLIAVPVAAVIGVMTRYALDEYKKTSVYSGKKKRIE